MLEDLLLEPSQRRARIDAELVEQRLTHLTEDAQRLGLTARSVEGEREVGPQAFTEVVAVEELAQLAGHRRVHPQLQLGGDAILGGSEASLLQPGGEAAGEVLVGELDEGAAPPEAVGLGETIEGLGGAPLVEQLPALTGQALEPPEVHLVGGDVEPVAGRLPRQHLSRPGALGVDRPTEPGDVALQRAARRRGHVVAPQLVDHRIDRHHPTRRGKQQREHPARLDAPEVCQRPVISTNLEVPQQAVPHRTSTPPPTGRRASIARLQTLSPQATTPRREQRSQGRGSTNPEQRSERARGEGGARGGTLRVPPRRGVDPTCSVDAHRERGREAASITSAAGAAGAASTRAEPPVPLRIPIEDAGLGEAGEPFLDGDGAGLATPSTSSRSSMVARMIFCRVPKRATMCSITPRAGGALGEQAVAAGLEARSRSSSVSAGRRSVAATSSGRAARRWSARPARRGPVEVPTPRRRAVVLDDQAPVVAPRRRCSSSSCSRTRRPSAPSSTM